MTKSFLASLIFNGAGIGFLLYMIKKIWSAEEWKKTCRNIGKKMSKWGRGKFGKSFWEPLETFIETRIIDGGMAFKEGADEDDILNNNK